MSWFSTKDKTFILTGDVGGTNSRLSLYPLHSSEPIAVHKFLNETQIPKDKRSQPSAYLNSIIIPFLRDYWTNRPSNPTVLACFAVAGVVSDNKVHLTNFDNMLMDGDFIAQSRTNAFDRMVVSCRIINDFVAQGYGCLTLKDTEVEHLHGPNTLNADGPRVCVGAGTGLGECYLTPSKDGEFTCFPSEGGHVEFAPRNAVEIKLFECLSEKFSSKHRISVERVVSGKGLANVYEFLVLQYPNRVDKHVYKEYERSSDKGRIVSQYATENMDKKCELCRQAMQIMMNAYGCEVGSAAIKWIPTGGLFVTGGVTPKNMQFIRGSDSDFMTSYLHKGRVSPLLDRIPLFAVLVEDLGVRGAQHVARLEYAESSSSKRNGASGWSTLLTASALGVILGAVMHKTICSK